MDIAPWVKNLIRDNAPTLLTALGLPPPFNIIAASIASASLRRYWGAATVGPGMADPVPVDIPVKSDTAPVKKPEEVVAAITHFADDDKMKQSLKDAEQALQKYQSDNDFKFAELAQKNIDGSRTFQAETGIGEKVFDAGYTLIKVSVVVMAVIVFVAIVAVRMEVINNNAAAVFGVVGAVIGFINGIAASVVNFYWGSSQGSKEKSQEMSKTLEMLGDGLVSAAKEKAGNKVVGDQNTITFDDTADPTPPPTGSPLSGAMPAGEVSRLVAPKMVSGALLQDSARDLMGSHCYVSAGVSWTVGVQGVAVEGATISGTSGKPVTFTSIFEQYGALCSTAAIEFGVPIELIVATIAVESGGRASSERYEPKLKESSIGLMQTLVSTARSALKDQNMAPQALYEPEMSIRAGTAYIAQQLGISHFDPPKVAAAYNAGSLRLDSGERNRWRMLCYPTGTGQHIDRFVQFYNDTAAVLIANPALVGDNVPCFQRLFSTAAAA
jgi:hypothetical protein